MQDKKIKVLYIAGFERSGSTLVNRVLGQLDGFVAWGELRDIWEHGFAENRACTCGASFYDCIAWQQVFQYWADSERAMTMVRLKERARAATLLEPLGQPGERLLRAVSKPYLAELEQFYQALKATTHSRVIVDSTKASWYGYVLSLLPSIDLYTVHIVRDPRGVCYSLQKRKTQGEPECQWYNPVHAALSWNLKNLAVEKFLKSPSKKYLRVRYEDFIDSPETAIKSLTSLLQEPVSELPLVGPAAVKMTVDHIITGSPSSRSNTGAVKLRRDETWKQ
ncbi:MAG: sulfotransferase, partial [Leptolyngbya sp. SIO4C1]|nr:sulfotransferase [Leptolyngbya sp. SIO4C1]